MKSVFLQGYPELYPPVKHESHETTADYIKGIEGVWPVRCPRVLNRLGRRWVRSTMMARM